MTPVDSFQSLLAKVQAGTGLAEAESEAVLGALMRGEVSETQMADLLTAWRDKGVTVDELTGAARAMRSLSVKITVSVGSLLDTCGTGGDGLDTFNISTVAALIVAGAGVPVAKHGNRGSTSRCGSADLLEELEVRIDADPAIVKRCIEEVGIGFLFAPKFHPAMKNVAPVRKRLGFRTIFNFLGPLTNPVNVTHQIIGVSDSEMVDVIANALSRLSCNKRFLIAHGVKEHMDEVSTVGPTRIVEFNEGGKVFSKEITPEGFGIQRAVLEKLQGRDRESCARIALEILEGKHSAYRDATILNAGFALYLTMPVTDFESAVKTAISRAEESVDSGRALKKLNALRKLSNS